MDLEVIGFTNEQYWRKSASGLYTARLSDPETGQILPAALYTIPQDWGALSVWPDSHQARLRFATSRYQTSRSQKALETDPNKRKVGVLMIRRDLEGKLDHYSEIREEANRWGIVKRPVAYRHKQRKGREDGRRGWEFLGQTRRPLENATFYLFPVYQQ